jgi:ERCC4-type nuclease
MAKKAAAATATAKKEPLPPESIELQGFPNIPSAVAAPKKNKAAKTVAPTSLQKYSVRIVVDERERELHNEMILMQNSFPALVQKEVMDIGDVAFYIVDNKAENGDTEPPKLIQIMERKTIADLLASITDGRYKEQCFRLMNSIDLPKHNMVYIIEGSMAKDTARKQRVYSAMTTLHFFKGISVMRTGSVKETAEWLLYTADKIEREWNKAGAGAGAGAGAEAASSTDYLTATGGRTTTGATKKRSNITTENIGEMMLCTIPGISVMTAKALIHRFGTFTKMMEELMKNPTGDLFENIKMEGGRRINRSVMDNLKHFLLVGAGAGPEASSSIS